MRPRLRKSIEKIIKDGKSIETLALFEAAHDETPSRNKLLQAFSTVGQFRIQLETMLKAHDADEEAEKQAADEAANGEDPEALAERLLEGSLQ